jgi:hypothetical protein
MHDLYRCARVPSLQTSVPTCHALLLLVGASFSLWRAAFLADKEPRSLNAQVKDAVGFLETIFSSNIINFADDKRFIDWTGGFYINNAGMRLLSVHELHPPVTTATPYKEFLEKFSVNSGSNETIDLWNLMYLALRSAIDLLMNELGISKIEHDD